MVASLSATLGVTDGFVAGLAVAALAVLDRIASARDAPSSPADGDAASVRLNTNEQTIATQRELRP